MRHVRLLLAALATLLALSGCHTVEGMGKDIKSAGGAIEDAGNR